MFDVLQNFLRKKSQMDIKTVEKICSRFTIIQTKSKEILVEYNDICKNYYFINEGCIRLFTVSQDGKESSRYFAFKGSFVTALPSFIEQKPAHEFLQTIKPSTLLVISRKDFYELVNNVVEFQKIYTEILELGFINAQKRIYGFQSFNALEKVRWIIKYQPLILSQVSNKMAASYLGITASTLSNIKRKL